jgi:hypothetical protein
VINEAYASLGHEEVGSRQSALSVYDSHEPLSRIKYGALCVGVILGVALVRVGEAERVLDGEDVMDADSVALSEALSEADSEALSEADTDALSVADSDADVDAVKLADRDAVLVAVLLGVIV